MRGKKPKPTALHVVSGTFRATRHKQRAPEPQPKGRPIRPKFLQGRAAKIWDEYLPRLFWLTAADSHSFGVWCGLAAEIEQHILVIKAAKITQWRLLGAELGMTPASRVRLGTVPGDGDNPASKYF